MFAGSCFDPAIVEWMRERGSKVVAVGSELDGVDLTVRYRHDDDPTVAVLTEVLVAELIAAIWWIAQPGPDGA